MDERNPGLYRPAGQEPMFNMPAVVVGLIALLGGLHAARAFLLTPDQDYDLLLLFAFFPARYAGGFVTGLPGGLGADVWSPVSYAFLHASVMHLVVNLVWLAAFGSAVARRLGTMRFLLLSAAAAAGGAGVHLLVQGLEGAPMIGASAAISGHMAAASRFIFTRARLVPLADGRGFRHGVAPLSELLRNRQVLAFLGTWFGINLLVGLLPMIVGGGDIAIAWEAHIGGFLVGLFTLPLFDRR